MLDDLDARLLLDANAEARHAETLSLASLGGTAALLAGFGAFIARSHLGGIGAFYALSPPIAVFGMILAAVGTFLGDRVKSADRRAQIAFKRLEERHPEIKSPQSTAYALPHPYTTTLAEGMTLHRYDGRFLPKIVRVLGFFIAILGTLGAIRFFWIFFTNPTTA